MKANLAIAAAAAPKRPARKRARPLIRSAGIRLAMVYATVFGLSAFALAFSLWYATVGLLQREVEVSVRNDANALNDRFSAGGIPALTRAINDRLAGNVDGVEIYLLIDSQGRHLAGDLDDWPPGLTPSATWYEWPIQRQGVGSTGLLQAFAIPGGGALLVGRDFRAENELRRVLRFGLLWAMGIMCVLGLIGALVIRALFRRMISEISATTRAISRGDLTRRVPKTGDGDEIDELAEIINDMLDRITRLMDGVREVSNSIAHDLRTPITRARTRLEDAALHASTADDLRLAIEHATDDLDGVVAVFEALLRIAEIEAGARRSAFAAIDLSPMLADIDELYRVVAEERGILLQTGIAASLPMYGDLQLIQLAVTNLIENALKFSAGDTIVAFTASSSDSTIQIRVADQGPGMREADRARATERFFRAESARSTTGSGLGLALVSAVANLHNGKLVLQDNHPGLSAIMVLPADTGPHPEM